ncbi:MAG TPA: DUF1707 domain-containing protein [Trebonia sp.]|nr:DUF1707 domain-containing protein [Trebonia sp.]
MPDRTSSGFVPGDLRVPAAAQDEALAELGEAFQVGRITAQELEHRSEQVLAARTEAEVTAPLADLPLTDLAARRAADLVRAGRVERRRLAASGSAAAAVVLAASSAEITLTAGLSWPGAVATAAVALLFAALFIVLRTPPVPPPPCSPCNSAAS